MGEVKKHTPGPWNCDKRTGDGKAILIRGNEHIADVDTDCNMDGEANAKLIAAAPEMLSTLINCHKHLSFLRDSIDGEERMELDESLDSILTVIKKATE